MNDTHQSMSTETALRLLTEQPRRCILRRVADTADGTTVEQLATHLGEDSSKRSRRNGTDGDQPLQLHHVHLPKLAEADVVTYHATRGEVHRGQEFQTVYSLLETIDDHLQTSSMDRP